VVSDKAKEYMYSLLTSPPQAQPSEPLSPIMKFVIIAGVGAIIYAAWRKYGN
jgi:hypothetical protein